jgi:hypothetical protein
VEIETAHANAARNAGMKAAQGVFIRFLDDDDVLYPEEGRHQIDLLERTGADICTGAVNISDGAGAVLQNAHVPPNHDFAAAVLAPNRMPLPVAYVYRRSALPSIEWNIQTPCRQDIEWLMNLAAAREYNWVVTHRAVGEWIQHGGPRVSVPYTTNKSHALTVTWISRTVAALQQRGAATDDRLQAAAEGILASAHLAFPFSPFHWHRVMRHAKQLHNEARLTIRIANIDIAEYAPPLLCEWALLPGRLVSTAARRAYFSIVGTPHVRKV